MTEAWRAQLRPASFRGVPFQVLEHSSPVGRRIDRTEFPKRDNPRTDDLGRKQRVYRISGYVTGDDYHRQRDSLMRAAEKSGPGTLIHPTLGVKLVMCETCEPREMNNRARMCLLDFEFVEAGENGSPLGFVDRAAQVFSRAQESITNATDQFTSLWNLEGAPSYIIGMASDTIAETSSFLAGLAAPASPTGSLQAIANLGNNAATLVDSAEDLGAGFVETFAGLFGTDNYYTTAQLEQLVRTFNEYGNNSSGASDATIVGNTPIMPSGDSATVGGALLNESIGQLVVFVRALAIANVAAVILDLEYEYLEQVVSLRNTLCDTIDTLYINEYLGDGLYSSLCDLYSALVNAIPEFNSELPNLTTTRLQGETPALVLANHLYTHERVSDRAAEIISRNGISNPLFVPAETDIKVLSV